MRCLFVAQNFNSGGVQRSFVNTCNALLDNFSDIDIDVFTFSGGAMMAELSDKINITKAHYLLNLLLKPIDMIKAEGRTADLFFRYALVLAAKLMGTEKLYRTLFKREKINKEYDIAVSFFTDVDEGVSNKGTDWYVADYVKAAKKYAWIHNDPVRAKFNIGSCLKRYRKYDKLVCVSEAVKRIFDEVMPEYADKTCVVYNVFPVRRILEQADEYVPFDKRGKFNIITVARVDNKHKRPDRIIDVCRKLKQHGVTGFYWRVVGGGPDLEADKAAAEEAGLEDVLSFKGQKDNPYPWVKHSDLFVLTSDYEGYPMVIGEAFALGVPAVTTGFAAAREMVSDDNGIVTGMDADEIYKAVDFIMHNAEAYKKIKQGCGKTDVNGKWYGQIDMLINGR